MGRGHLLQSSPWLSGLGATGLASALADGVGDAPSALPIRFGPLDWFQRSALAHPFRHLLFSAAGGVVWLSHQHPAAAALDGGDAALVCLIPLGVAARVCVGGGAGSSSAVLSKKAIGSDRSFSAAMSSCRR